MRPGALAFLLPLVLVLAGCGRLPGARAEAESPARPEDVLGFHTLYSANCQACHGANGHNGPAMEIGNPEYQALVDDATLRKWISGGMPGTEMPAFAQSAGGMLTDAQINAIIAGMRKEWSRQMPLPAQRPRRMRRIRPAMCSAGNKRIRRVALRAMRSRPATGGKPGVSVAGERSGAADNHHCRTVGHRAAGLVPR